MKDVDVLLVVPPFDYASLKNVSAIVPHLGISYIGAVLEREGYHVEILDAQALRLHREQISDIIRKMNAPVVGVTAVTAEFTSALNVLRIVKDINKSTISILGGPHATIMPQTAYSEYIDYIVIGEGEVTIIELINFILKGIGNRDEIKGIGYKKNGTMHLTGRRELIKNLDEIPFPAYHLLPMDKYRNYAMFDDGFRFATMITSRGCPIGCTYCTSSAVFGYKWRTISPKRVLENVKLLYEKYGVRHIYFQDDEFTLNSKRAKEICERIIESRMNLQWGCLSRVTDINEELVHKMVKAGCREIAFGVETGYQEGLDKIKKRVTLEQVKKAVTLTTKYRIFTGVSFIMGFPWEGEKDIKKTVQFAKSLPADIFYFQILVPYPMTEIYTEMKKSGLIVSNDWDRYIQHAITGSLPVIKTYNLTNKQLQYLNGKAYLEVYLNPTFILRKLRRIRNYTHVKRNIKAGCGLIRNALIKVIYNHII